MTPAQDPEQDNDQEQHHEQHRVLAIRGKSYCNSACVFCIEKFTQWHAASPGVDETRQLILEGSGRYNMLFFMNGEPSLSPRLFEHVELARAHGYRYFGMSSHFRAFADPAFALAVLDAGFEFFDISLHAATHEGQLAVNPIDDGGRSLKEALHGLRNILELSRRQGRRVAVTHKIVITQLNCKELLSIFRTTYRLGVRSYILQPVKVSGLDPALGARLAIGEEQFMPFVNQLLASTEGSGAKIKLYGMSQLGAQPSGSLVQESNLVRHAAGRPRAKDQPHMVPDLFQGDRLIPDVVPSASAVGHRVTVRLPMREQSATFDCKEDQIILNAALASGVALPFGCRMGSCGQCCGRIVEGAVEMREQLVLSDAQIRSGLRLLCQSMPRSDVVIVTHQESELGV